MQLHRRPQGRTAGDPSQSGLVKPSTLVVYVPRLEKEGLAWRRLN